MYLGHVCYLIMHAIWWGTLLFVHSLRLLLAYVFALTAYTGMPGHYDLSLLVLGL